MIMYIRCLPPALRSSYQNTLGNEIRYMTIKRKKSHPPRSGMAAAAKKQQPHTGQSLNHFHPEGSRAEGKPRLRIQASGISLHAELP
jgi:hypothetical protein